MGQVQNLSANTGKFIELSVGETSFLRIPVRTHLIGADDDIVDVAKQYLDELVQENDIVFISEKVVSITQGRAIPVAEIKPRPLATWLSKYVTKTPAGIGLGMPETMEMALRECGVLRILFAAFVSVISKVLLRRSGDFYRIAGAKARSIDGPTTGTIAPYNQYVVLGPDQPDQVAQEISHALGGVAVVISDINDLGGNILGGSRKDLDYEHILLILKDNPLGQGDEQTPIGIIRQV